MTLNYIFAIRFLFLFIKDDWLISIILNVIDKYL
jgi:hypothetical protein